VIRGNAKFDSISVGEFSGSFLGSTLAFEAKAAFVNSKTGDTHGWTKNGQWSPPVIEKLKELRALMEIDLGRLHLEGGGEVLVSTSAGLPRASGGGLGEHFSGDSGGSTEQV
jgi:hypothetical protein